jgi:hypothetical protein
VCLLFIDFLENCSAHVYQKPTRNDFCKLCKELFEKELKASQTNYFKCVLNWKEKMRFFILVKSVVVVVCLIMFLILMKDVWNKFESKLTSTGVQFRTEKMTKRKLPHLTICPWPSFKKQGILYATLCKSQNFQS